MLNSGKPLWSGQPLLSGHFLIHRGWPLNRDLTMLSWRDLGHILQVHLTCFLHAARICYVKSVLLVDNEKSKEGKDSKCGKCNKDLWMLRCFYNIGKPRGRNKSACFTKECICCRVPDELTVHDGDKIRVEGSRQCALLCETWSYDELPIVSSTLFKVGSIIHVIMTMHLWVGRRKRKIDLWIMRMRWYRIVREKK